MLTYLLTDPNPKPDFVTSPNPWPSPSLTVTLGPHLDKEVAEKEEVASTCAHETS